MWRKVESGGAKRFETTVSNTEKDFQIQFLIHFAKLTIQTNIQIRIQIKINGKEDVNR